MASFTMHGGWTPKTNGLNIYKAPGMPVQRSVTTARPMEIHRHRGEPTPDLIIGRPGDYTDPEAARVQAEADAEAALARELQSLMGSLTLQGVEDVAARTEAAYLDGSRLVGTRILDSEADVELVGSSN